MCSASRQSKRGQEGLLSRIMMKLSTPRVLALSLVPSEQDGRKFQILRDIKVSQPSWLSWKSCYRFLFHNICEKQRHKSVIVQTVDIDVAEFSSTSHARSNNLNHRQYRLWTARLQNFLPCHMREGTTWISDSEDCGHQRHRIYRK